MSSDEDGAELMAAFQRRRSPEAIPPKKAHSPVPATDSMPGFNSGADETTDRARTPSKKRQLLCVRAQPVRNREQYIYFEPRDEVEEVLREFSRKGDMWYEVTLFGKASKQVSVTSKVGRFEAVKAE
jgi:hypothetical protein